MKPLLEKIKWALWQLHFQQIAYKKKYDQYATSLVPFTPIQVNILGYTFFPILENYANGYQILAKGINGGQWIINERGQIVKR